MNLIKNADKQKVDTQPLSKHISAEHLNLWRSDQLSAQALVLSLPDACVDELDLALSRTGDAKIPDTVDRQQFRHCDDLARELLHRLDNDALGAAIVDRLPSERYNDLDNRRICGMFSSFVGQLMEQNFAGITLYDVKNTNPKNPDRVRKSITNHAQPYHTDGGWHRKPAKYVGLYCVRNATSGGGSKITSMLSAFTSLQEMHPEQMQTLLEHHPWDMQGEHPSQEKGFLMNPMFEIHDNQFLSRYYESYVRSGYRIKGDELPEQLDLALHTLRDTIHNQPNVRFEMISGQFQYLNNWTALHSREAFNDTKQTPEDETRHVIRVWNH